MQKKYESEKLKLEERAAFRRKQLAWAKYAEARNQTDVLAKALQEAWEKRNAAKAEMGEEHKKISSVSSNYRDTWEDYVRIRDYNNSKIRKLREDAEREHKEMQRCFDCANEESRFGNKSLAKVHFDNAYAHKKRRDEINDMIVKVCNENQKALQEAERNAPRADSTAYRAAKKKYEDARALHESIEAEFKQMKAKRDFLKAEFFSAKAEHDSFKKDLEGDFIND